MKSHLNQKNNNSSLDSEEEKQLDELLQQLRCTASKSKSIEADTFFNELVEMLQQPDPPLKEIKEAPQPQQMDDDDSAEEDLFDQIIGEIPPEQLSLEHHHDYQTESEVRNEIAEIESELEANYQKNVFLHKMRDEFMSQQYIEMNLMKRKGLAAQNKIDHERIDHHYSMIKLMVNELSIFSPARKAYLRIIKDDGLDHYDKVQQLITMAQRFLDERQGRKIGFFQRHLGKKALLVHKAIARIDINRNEARVSF